LHPLRHRVIRALFQLGEEQCGHRAGNPAFLRAGHSHSQRTHLKSFLGLSGCASNTVPGGSVKFRRGGSGSDVFFLVFMVVAQIFHHHEPFVKPKKLPGLFKIGRNCL
jgi:hypothetical protein